MTDFKKKHEIRDLKLDEIEPSEDNPNEQDDREFNSLCEDIQSNGFVEPIQVVLDKAKGKYKIVGGEHRWRACRLLEFETIPAVILPETFDEDKRKVQIVRWNMIKGKLNPVKFSALFNDLASKYQPEILKAMMAFNDDNLFNKVYQEAKSSLPQELKEKLDAAKDEIKTIDGLATVLNSLFTNYGDSLKYNFMAFSFGGKMHWMIKMNKETKKKMDEITKQCMTEGIDINDKINELMSGNKEAPVEDDSVEVTPKE